MGLLAIFGLSLIGCASPPKDSGFGDVQQMATEHIGHAVQWNQHTDDDQAVEASVHAMLHEELTLDRAVQIALINNHNLQASYEDLGIAQADLVQAGLLQNPVFNAIIRLPDGGGITDMELSVTQNFIDLLSMPLRKKVAAASFESTKLKVAQQIVDLAGEAQAAFYSAQAAQQIAQMQHAVMQSSAASFDATKRIHDAENMSDLDFATQQAQYEQAKLDEAQGEADSALARERLNEIMGVWGSNTEWKITSHLPEMPATAIPIDGLEQFALKQRLDLAQARQEVEVASRNIRASNLFGPFTDSSLGIDTEHDPSGQWVTGPTLSIPIPLFDTGQAKVAKLKAQWRQAHEQYAAKSVEVRSQVRTAWRQMQAAHDRAEEYRTAIVPLRQKIVEQTQLQYNGMLVGVFQLLDAKQNEIDANREYVASLREYWLARTGLQKALGGRLPKDQGELK
jgi:cobalt-zinc-cadmium efflux system outer membrane protein